MAKAVSVTSDDLKPVSSRPQASTRQRGAIPSSELVPMQFKMPPEFATAFRVEAAKRGLKYNALLQAAFDALLKG